MLFGSVGTLVAQWQIQDITLAPGWNAVHLEVAPDPAGCNELFAGLPIESVWKWNRHFIGAEFNKDPHTLLPRNPHWLVWFPPDSPSSFLTRLYNVSAGSTYLIKVKDSAAPFVLSVRGISRVVNPEWVPNSLNLVGFYIDPANTPCFSDFFNYTDNVITSQGFDNELYKVAANGENIIIATPARDKMEPGAAYWIKCKFVPKDSSVLGVPEGSELKYVDFVDEQSLVIRNNSSATALKISLCEKASLNPPVDTGCPERAGDVPLSYYAYNSQSNYWYWKNIGVDEVLTNSLAPGEQKEFRFAVRRNDFSSYTPVGTNGYTYQNIMEIKCVDAGVLYKVPVSATPTGESNAVSQTSNPSKGLWVGDAKLYKVNCPAYFTSNITVSVVSTNNESGEVTTNEVEETLPATNMLPTDSVCSLRLIVHIDSAGKAKLLEEVFLAKVPLDNERGEYRLFADRDDLPADATDISRICSVAFPFMDPVDLTGSATNRLTGTVTVGCNDPVNPFMHKYNPLHDNKDWDYNEYTNGVETLTVTRNISMEFANADTNAPVDPFWGSSIKGGVYRETLIGLRKQPVMTEGSFTLKRISLLDKLY